MPFKITITCVGMSLSLSVHDIQSIKWSYKPWTIVEVDNAIGLIRIVSSPTDQGVLISRDLWFRVVPEHVRTHIVDKSLRTTPNLLNDLALFEDAYNDIDEPDPIARYSNEPDFLFLREDHWKITNVDDSVQSDKRLITLSYDGTSDPDTITRSTIQLTWYDFWIRLPASIRDDIINASDVQYQNALNTCQVRGPQDQRPPLVRKFCNILQAYENVTRNPRLNAARRASKAANVTKRLREDDYTQLSLSRRETDFYARKIQKSAALDVPQPYKYANDPRLF